MAEAALDGFSVLEDGGGIAASYAGKLLADLGADVIKVECPNGDEVRRMSPFPEDEPGREWSGLHLFLDTNKRSVTLDLTTQAASDVLARLIPQMDVAIVNYRPDVAARLGVD